MLDSNMQIVCPYIFVPVSIYILPVSVYIVPVSVYICPPVRIYLSPCVDLSLHDSVHDGLQRLQLVALHDPLEVLRPVPERLRHRHVQVVVGLLGRQVLHTHVTRSCLVCDSRTTVTPAPLLTITSNLE